MRVVHIFVPTTVYLPDILIAQHAPSNLRCIDGGFLVQSHGSRLQRHEPLGRGEWHLFFSWREGIAPFLYRVDSLTCWRSFQTDTSHNRERSSMSGIRITYFLFLLFDSQILPAAHSQTCAQKASLLIITELDRRVDADVQSLLARVPISSLKLTLLPSSWPRRSSVGATVGARYLHRYWHRGQPDSSLRTGGSLFLWGHQDEPPRAVRLPR